MTGYTKKPHLCPVCGKFMFPDLDQYEVCDVCGWEDEQYQIENPDEDACANTLSLDEYRKKYEEGWWPYWLD